MSTDPKKNEEIKDGELDEVSGGACGFENAKIDATEEDLPTSSSAPKGSAQETG